MTRRKNRIGTSIALIGIAVSGIRLASADVQTYMFTGTVTSVSGSPFGLNPVSGDKVKGTISYDPSQQGYVFGCGAAYSQDPPSGMSLTIAGVTLRSEKYNSFQVINDCYGIDNFNGYFTPIKVGTADDPQPSSISFGLTDRTQTVFNSVALPFSLNAESFVQRQGGAHDSASGESVNFTIDALMRPFAGTPGEPNCRGQSVSALAEQYGGIDVAARILGYPSVKALQDAVKAFCEA